MKEVEQIVYQTLIRDTGAGGLLDLLSDDLVTPVRVLHAFQIATPPSPGITFGVTAAPKGMIPRFTREVFVTFNIYANNYSDISFRLTRLFDGVDHDLSLISGGAVQIGGLTSVFDFEGPDGFDESLEVQKKDMRFRFFTAMKAQNPI